MLFLYERGVFMYKHLSPSLDKITLSLRLVDIFNVAIPQKLIGPAPLK